MKNNKRYKTKKIKEGDSILYSIIKIMVILFLTIFYFYFLIDYIYEKSILDDRYNELNNKYEYLSEKFYNCMDNLRTLDTSCWEYSDCIYNMNLTGCSYDGCNYYCCSQSLVTDMMTCSGSLFDCNSKEVYFFDDYKWCNGMVDENCPYW